MLLVLALILLVAIGLRLWRVDVTPPGFHLDESFEGTEAWRILTDPSYRPVYLAGNFGVPPLNAYANALTFGLFRTLGGEPGPLAMRLTAALFGVAGVLAVFALGGELRRLDPARLTAVFPLWAAAFLATLRWHVHFSRMGIEPILVPLEWAAATWLLLRGWRTGAWWAFGAAGAVLAATLYTYQGAWLIPPLAAATVGLLWLHEARRTERRSLRRPLLGALLAAIVATVLALPFLVFAMQNLNLIVLRPTQIATAGGHAATNLSPFESARAYLLMFVPWGQTGDLDPRRNLPGAAVLNIWQALPFALGLALALWRIRTPAYSIPLLGLAGLLLPGVFSEYAPHFHRVLGAAAPTAVLAGFGLDAVWSLWARRSRPARRAPAWLGWASAVLLVLGGVTAARDYFIRWAALPDLFAAFDAGLWQIGQDVAGRSGDTFYLTPRDWSHPTLAFASLVHPGARARPITFDGRHIFPAPQNNVEPETYIAIQPEDFRTRLLLPEVLPAAQVEKEIHDAAGQVYATYYTRPAGSPAQRPPQHPVVATLGDGIGLAGYDVQTADLAEGRMLYVQLHWLADATPARDWTVFTHLLRREPDGAMTQVAGADSRPGAGSLPTTSWAPGWLVLDEYQIRLPADLAPGSYWLEVGLYAPDGARLPTAGTGLLLGEVLHE